jgi:hypothetical protein
MEVYTAPSKILSKISRINTNRYWKIYKLDESCYQELSEFMKGVAKDLFGEYIKHLDLLTTLIDEYKSGQYDETILFTIAYVFISIRVKFMDTIKEEEPYIVQDYLNSVMRGNHKPTKAECDYILQYVDRSRKEFNVDLIDILNTSDDILKLDRMRFSRRIVKTLPQEIPLLLWGRLIEIQKIQVELRYNSSVKVFLVDDRNQLINTNMISVL